MSEFLKPQSPLQHKDGAFFYPLTTEDQVIMEDGSRLSATLEDIKDKVDNIDFSALDLGDVVYAGDEYTESTTVTVNADTLGGKPESELSVAKATNADTLGGKPAEYFAPVGKLPVKNLLDNSNFAKPLNRRGQTSYINGVETPTIDRWLIYYISGACLYVEDGYIRLTTNNSYSSGSWSLIQTFPTGTLTADSYTLAYCDTDGNITINNSPRTTWYGDITRAIRIEGTEETKLVWAALYEGEYTLETLPEYQPKSYNEEFLASYIGEAGNLSGRELLWENSSPSSGFPATNINYIRWSDYSQLQIITEYYVPTAGSTSTLSNKQVSTFVDCELGKLVAAESFFKLSTYGYRTFTLEDGNIINVSAGGTVKVSAGGFTEDKQYQVPIRIYGIR